jgi:hypothetical protein
MSDIIIVSEPVDDTSMTATVEHEGALFPIAGLSPPVHTQIVRLATNGYSIPVAVESVK